MGRLEGKVALVTGAASGIGRASAKLFASEGAKVVAADRAASVEETAKDIRDAGGEAIALIVDAGLEADVARAVEAAVAQFGGLDVCYANAGVGTTSFDPPLEQTGEQWLELLRVNLVGPFLAIKHASKAMRDAGKGSIICTASVAGLRSGAGGLAYSASKAGVINLVQTCANQLYGTGVRVNAICPGTARTPMVDEAVREDPSLDEYLKTLHPIGRIGEAMEIAEAAVWLCTPAASFVLGAALPVDGGYVIP